MGGLGALELSFGTEPFPRGQGGAAKGHHTSPALQGALSWGWQDATAWGQLGWGNKGFSWRFNASYSNSVEAKVGVHLPCSSPAQSRAEASCSIWRMLCLPRAPSPGNPSAAVAKTTEMFVIYVLHQAVSSAGGKGAREEDQRLTAL